MPEAAERALISVATAYRYFPTADDLWFEASSAAAGWEPILADADTAVIAAGDDPLARLEAVIRRMGFRMLDDQVPFRWLARAALDQWFSHRVRRRPDVHPSARSDAPFHRPGGRAVAGSAARRRRRPPRPRGRGWSAPTRCSL